MVGGNVEITVKTIILGYAVLFDRKDLYLVSEEKEAG
jgi:hypothetical protein